MIHTTRRMADRLPLLVVDSRPIASPSYTALRAWYRLCDDISKTLAPHIEGIPAPPSWWVGETGKVP